MSAKKRFLFTSESVTEGHPDKVADQISDAVLDAMLAKDPNSRVACETLVTTGLIFVAGEITTKAIVNIPEVARETVRQIGYTKPHLGFDWENCAVMTSIDRQSPDISQGVTEGQGLFKEQGAGDQGLMFGYACDETPELMPLSISLAHKLSFRLAEVRKKKILIFLEPDGKSQVTIEYVDHKPARVEAVVISTQHSADVSDKKLRDGIIKEVINKIIPAKMMDKNTKIFVNPTGRFVIGGPKGDTGLTGRKIIVDTYGGVGSHGGGAFSGKDPSKVDRTASYMARHVAKNIVAAKLANRCELQVAYAIGVAEPVSIMVNTKGTGVIPDAEIEDIVKKVFDFRPKAMIEYLKMKRPVFQKTAAYGHFGRNDKDFTWEGTAKAKELRKLAGLKG
jgi:S-adenosylmethionine synthetase